MFLCIFLLIGGTFLYEQFRHKGRGSGNGVEYNQDGSIRSVTDERADKALRRLECFDKLGESPLRSEVRNCETLP